MISGRAVSAKGDAGVSLYSTSADLATLQNSDDTNKALEQKAQNQLKTAKTAKVNGVQNQDGTWSGSHCITGRTVCTAAALMVLMVDRARTPVVLKLKPITVGRK